MLTKVGAHKRRYQKVENYMKLIYPRGKKRACTLAQMGILGGKEEDGTDRVAGLESLRP